jgi:hypothetical protein
MQATRDLYWRLRRGAEFRFLHRDVDEQLARDLVELRI